MNDHQILQRPIVTEKSTIERETDNVVTFAVHPDANKIEIKRAVERLFDVSVVDVRTSRVQGKKKRVGRFLGRRSSWKKARVKLRVGDHIEFFEGV
ncbi:MAG: 50S ribosomal protein L23 [Proteobacteria bacterium]|nr:50S ribosomal protein L23 [Pseudomonadota bacterium]